MLLCDYGGICRRIFGGNVSILVLVDVALRRMVGRHKLDSQEVSILVLVDVALRQEKE